SRAGFLCTVVTTVTGVFFPAIPGAVIARLVVADFAIAGICLLRGGAVAGTRLRLLLQSRFETGGAVRCWRRRARDALCVRRRYVQVDAFNGHCCCPCARIPATSGPARKRHD